MASRFLGTSNQPRQDLDSGSLLSALAYDDDAASLHSRSDQDSDSDDDALQQRARNSRELAAHDRIVLLEEEETDKLITKSRAGRQQPTVVEPLFSKAAKLLTRRLSQGAVGNSNQPERSSLTSNRSASTDELASDEKRRSRRNRRERKKDRLLAGAVHGEDGALMYELEEGGMREGSDTGDSSDRDDDQDMKQLLVVENANTKPARDFWAQLLIYSMIAVGFALAVLGVWKLSIRSKDASDRDQPVQLANNGTALFAPTTIIISLDGFRADFLQRNITPRLNAFVKEGVSPQYMLPSFPSVTFPNHYTLATGLYPESHGIVSNTFWDPESQREFHYTDPTRSLDPSWWSGEPFWVTAERQGIRTAIHMWPGSEAHILGVEPSFIDKFNGKEVLPKKVDRILELLDMPGLEDPSADIATTRPQLIAAYVPNVDGDGHTFGPNSTEVSDTIRKADGMLDSLFQGLDARNLTHIVNVIVVSDHGMATTDVTRLVQLEDLVDMDLVERYDGWPLYGIRLKNESDLERVHAQLVETTKTNPNLEIYLRDVDMPERYHFSNNDRIAPLWIVPKTGWAIVTKDEMVVADALSTGEVYHPRGLHGYDHEHPLMRAIFVARGPAFPHPPNSRIDHFQNINVYNILCDSVGMTPKPNNGTLRLPLKPIGQHSPADLPAIPEDPVPANTIATSSSSVVQSTAGSAEPTSPNLPNTPSPPSTPSSPKPVAVDPAPTSSADEKPDDNGDKGIIVGIWDWLTDKAEGLWDAVTGESKNKDGKGAQKRGS